MKISLVHPSKGRPEMAINTMKNWVNKSINPQNIEYIFSLDLDDDRLLDYSEQLKYVAIPYQTTVNDNSCLVEAANIGVKQCKGDLIILVSDDFDCPVEWDIDLIRLLPRDASKPKAILVDDGICLTGDILSLPIINRAMYERLGYIYHPDFFSLFADNALLEVAKKLNGLIDARHLLFQHKHYINGMAEEDATYKHENSKEAYQIGKIAIEALRLRNYDL